MAVLKNNVRRENSGFTQYGIAAFVTTATTFELPVGFNKILSFALTPIGAYSANDQLSLDETATNGVIMRPATGTVTVTRNSSGTSALPFAYVLHCE